MGELVTNLAPWALGAAGVLAALFAALLWMPAKASILFDTAGSTGRAEMRLLGGMGPAYTWRALPKDGGGVPLARFHDPARIGFALMTPGIAEAAFDAVRRVYALNPAVTRVEVGFNLPDTSQSMVVQTAVQAALAGAPAALHERVRLYKCEALGAELSAAFEVFASPMELRGIWSDFKNSRSVREFRKRLKRKPKPQKKAPKEVRAA